MGVFPLSNPPPASQNASINMIYTSHADKGKAIADEASSFSPFEEIYNAIQATSDSTINDHLLVSPQTIITCILARTPPISRLSFKNNMSFSTNMAFEKASYKVFLCALFTHIEIGVGIERLLLLTS